MSSLSRCGLRSLLHPGHCCGRLLFPPAEGVGVRHRHVRQRDRHLRAGAVGAAAHRAVLLEGGAARPQRLRRQPLRVRSAAPTNQATGGWGAGGGRGKGVRRGGETWWGAVLYDKSTVMSLPALCANKHPSQTNKQRQKDVHVEHLLKSQEGTNNEKFVRDKVSQSLCTLLLLLLLLPWLCMSSSSSSSSSPVCLLLQVMSHHGTLRSLSNRPKNQRTVFYLLECLCLSRWNMFLRHRCLHCQEAPPLSCRGGGSSAPASCLLRSTTSCCCRTSWAWLCPSCSWPPAAACRSSTWCPTLWVSGSATSTPPSSCPSWESSAS